MQRDVWRCGGISDPFSEIFGPISGIFDANSGIFFIPFQGYEWDLWDRWTRPWPWDGPKMDEFTKGRVFSMCWKMNFVEVIKVCQNQVKWRENGVNWWIKVEWEKLKLKLRFPAASPKTNSNQPIKMSTEINQIQSFIDSFVELQSVGVIFNYSYQFSVEWIVSGLKISRVVFCNVSQR